MQQRTIVIVEDTDTSASTLEIALEQLGHVVSAPGAAEAWKYLQSKDASDVCAVVTDLHMPGMDGFELIARLRGDVRYDKLPIIVISGCTDPRTPARVIELGANAFFGKPFSPAQVRAKVERLLNATQSPISM